MFHHFPINFILQTLNHPNTTCGSGDPKNHCITDMSSYVERPDITDVEPDHRFYLGFDNHRQNLSDIFRHNKFDHFMSKFRKSLTFEG